MTDRRSNDAQGYRMKFGVLGPSTNTIVQPDFDDLRVRGVTNHYSRIVVQDANAISNETFHAGTMEISQNTVEAVRGVLTCKPDYLVMGMSAVTFYGGREGGAAWKKNIEDVSGLGISIGSESTAKALEAYGGIKKVAVVSPYFPNANQEVIRYLGDWGYETVRDICFQCPSWTAIAQVPESQVREAFIELNGSGDVDAIIQVGTNLSAVRMAAAAEKWLAKPVIAINVATYWHALRTNGIKDQKEGFGRLMAEF